MSLPMQYLTCSKEGHDEIYSFLGITVEVEAGMEERLERLKSKIQGVKSALSIPSCTPMGNLLMME